jgi:hypothetical protein
MQYGATVRLINGVQFAGLMGQTNKETHAFPEEPYKLSVGTVLYPLLKNINTSRV